MDAFGRKTRSIADRYNITVLGGRYLDVWKRGALTLTEAGTQGTGASSGPKCGKFLSSMA